MLTNVVVPSIYLDMYQTTSSCVQYINVISRFFLHLSLSSFLRKVMPHDYKRYLLSHAAETAREASKTEPLAA